MLFVVAGWCWGKPGAVANAKRGGASHSSTVSQEEFHMDFYTYNIMGFLIEIAFLEQLTRLELLHQLGKAGKRKELH